MYVVSTIFIYLLLASNLDSKEFEEISRTYSDYKSKTYFKERLFDTSPSNFQKHISIFADCIVHIINFDGVDIPRNREYSKYITVVISRLDIVYVYFNESYSYHTFILPIEKMPKRNTTLDHKMTLQDWEWFAGDDFLHIQHNSLVQRRRETCGAHIYMHPPKWKNTLHWKEIPGGVFFPRLTLLSAMFWNILPKSLDTVEKFYRNSQINFRWHYEIILSESKITDYITRVWKTGLLFNYHWYYGAPRTNWELILWKLDTELNQIVSVYIFCHHCYQCWPHWPVQIDSEHFKSIHALQEKIAELNSPTDNIIWKIRRFSPWEETGNFMPYYDYKIDDKWDKILKYDDANLYLFTDQSYPISQSILDQRLLFYVLGNSTYQKSNNKMYEDLESDYCRKHDNRGCGCTSGRIDYIMFPHIDFYEVATWLPMHFPFHQVNFFCGLWS